MEVSLHQFRLAIKGRLDNFSSVVHTQISHQVALAITSHSLLDEDSRISYLVDAVEELRRLWAQRPPSGDTGPDGPSGPPGGS